MRSAFNVCWSGSCTALCDSGQSIYIHQGHVLYISSAALELYISRRKYNVRTKEHRTKEHRRLRVLRFLSFVVMVIWCVDSVNVFVSMVPD